MKCVISGPNAAGRCCMNHIEHCTPNVRTRKTNTTTISPFLFTVMSKAIRSIARIGHEMVLEATDDGLAFRTANLSTSAFALFTFQPEFFEEFSVTDSPDAGANSCKLLVITCLHAFVNMKRVSTGTDKTKTAHLE